MRGLVDERREGLGARCACRAASSGLPDPTHWVTWPGRAPVAGPTCSSPSRRAWLLEELERAVARGARAVQLFLVGRDDVSRFRPADDIAGVVRRVPGRRRPVTACPPLAGAGSPATSTPPSESETGAALQSAAAASEGRGTGEPRDAPRTRPGAPMRAEAPAGDGAGHAPDHAAEPAPADRQTLPSGAVWMRALHSVVLAIACHVVLGLLALVALFQIVWALVTRRRPDPRVQGFGGALTSYTAEVFRYLTFNADTPPFPFSDLPARSE